MGAKALEVEGRARDVLSVAAKLDRISGHGRVILTAANPTERAWKNQRIGHGFLTYYLLEALLGPEELRRGDQISVLKMLQHVVQSVTNAARSIQRVQNPAVRGTFNDDYTWRVLKKGPLYDAFSQSLQARRQPLTYQVSRTSVSPAISSLVGRLRYLH